METPQSWEIILPQNIDKQHTDVPDFTGDACIGSTLYDAAAWFREISKGQNIGRPFVGLQLTSKGNVSQKVSISLWEKQNRTNAADPHFKTKEQLNGQNLKFAAWIVPTGGLYSLRIVIEPFSASANDLSEAALETHTRLQDFLEQSQLRLSNSESQAPAKLSAPENNSDNITNKRSGKPKPAALKRAVRDEPDPDLDVEPDSIPF
jgi:hypothetical protein